MVVRAAGEVGQEADAVSYDPECAGTLSLAMLDRMFDEMWNQPHPDAYLDASSPARDWEYGYGSSRMDRQPTRCNAVLFPLPTDMWEPAIWRGQVVHPAIVRMIGPMQGPQPAACAREPHPDSPYHWDGRGTWWR